MLGKLKGKIGSRVNSSLFKSLDPTDDLLKSTTSPSNQIQLSDVNLSATGPYHNDVLLAKVDEDLVGGMGMEETIDVSWYRKTNSTGNASSTDEVEYIKIKGVSSAYYSPSADDVGATICFRCSDKDDPTNQGFAQIGPLVMEPTVSEGVKKALTSTPPGLSFQGTMPSRPGETITISFDAKGISIMDIDDEMPKIFHQLYVNGIAVEIDPSTPSGMDVIGFNVASNVMGGSSSKGSKGSKGGKNGKNGTTNGTNEKRKEAHVHTRLRINFNNPRDRDVSCLGIRALCDAARSKVHGSFLVSELIFIETAQDNSVTHPQQIENDNQTQQEDDDEEEGEKEIGDFGFTTSSNDIDMDMDNEDGNQYTNLDATVSSASNTTSSTTSSTTPSTTPSTTASSPSLLDTAMTNDGINALQNRSTTPPPLSIESQLRLEIIALKKTNMELIKDNASREQYSKTIITELEKNQERIESNLISATQIKE